MDAATAPAPFTRTDFERVTCIAQHALDKARAAATTEFSESRRLVNYLRSAVCEKTEPLFQDSLVELCEAFDRLPGMPTLAGVAKVLGKLTTASVVAANAIRCHPCYYQYVAWDWTMLALEELVRLHRLVATEHSRGWYTFATPPPKPPSY